MKKSAPKTDEMPRVARSDDPADRAIFNRGRAARLNGIKRDDAPYVGKDAKAWLKGWDYEDGVQPVSKK